MNDPVSLALVDLYLREKRELMDAIDTELQIQDDCLKRIFNTLENETITETQKPKRLIDLS